MKGLSKKFIYTTFIIALSILLFISYLTYKSIDAHFSDEQLISQSLTCTQTAEALMGDLSDASADRRGYLITSDSIFLIEYNESIKKVDSLFLKLRQLTNNNPEQKKYMDSVEPMILNRVDLFKESLELQEKKKRNLNEQSVYTKKGKAIQDSINNIIYKVEEINSADLKLHHETLNKSAEISIISLFSGLSISFILLISGFVLLIKEIKQRINFEKALEDSRNWFSTTLASIGDGVIVTNHLGDITFMNNVAEGLTGWKLEEAEGMYLEKIFNIVKEFGREKIENPIQRVYRTGKVVGLANHTILINKSGRDIPIDDSAAPILSNDLKLLGMVLVFRDITERRKNELELENSRRFSQKIADSTPNVLYLYELNGPRIVYVNKNIQAALGYSPETVINMQEDFFSNLMFVDDYKRLLGRYKQYLSAGENEVLENVYRIKNKDGRWRWMQSFDVIFARDEDGKPTQILGSAIDITERKGMEEELKKYSLHLEELVESRTFQLKSTNDKLQNEILERIKAEKNIMEAEERFRKLVENSLVGIYIIQENRFSYVNPKMEEMLGYKPGDLLNLEIKDLVVAGDYPIVKENIRKRVDKEIQSIQYSFRGLKKDGSIIDLEVKGTSIEINNINSIIGTVQDVTERNSAVQELKNSEEKFRIIAETASEGIITLDEVNNILFVNGYVEKIFGYNKSELIGNNADIIIPTEGKDTHSSGLMNFFKKKEANKEILRKQMSGIQKNGSKIPIEISFGGFSNKGKKYFTGIIRDITEQKKAEEEIKNQREYLRKIIDTNPNFIFAKDWDGRFTLVNRAVADTYGTTVEDLIGKTDADFNPNKSEVEHFLKDDRDVITTQISKLIAEEPVYNSETREALWYQTIKVPMVTPNGEVQVLGVSTDITARKKAEEGVKKSLKEKELLLQEIHHRVKNNLQIVVSLLKLQAKYIYDDRDLDIFNKSRARIETMSLIHEKLYKSTDIENINICNYLKDLTNYLLKAYGVNQSNMEIKFKADNVNLGIDTAIPCGLIINELFSNSLKHAFSPEQKGCIEIEVLKDDDKIYLTVADNGKGIPSTYDIKKSDSLGLRLVNTLVKQMDGTMTITNANGTRFYFTLRELKYRERIKT